MNFKQLEVFRTIMDTGSTIAAAAALGLSQSAISRQLSALEDDIGRELFLRDKGRLIPRPEARLLIREVEEVGDSLARLRAKIGDVRSGAFGETQVRIAFPHSLTSTMLPPILKAFIEAHPKVTVEVLAGPYDAIERMVRGRTADLGFVRLPPEDPGFDARALFESGMVCVMAADHPLAARETIDVADLAREDLILLGRQRVTRGELEHDLRHAVPSYRCRLEVHSVEAACALAAEGLGVAIVTTLLAGYLKRDAGFAMRPFRSGRPSQYGIISVSGTPLSWPAEALVRLIATHAPAEFRLGAGKT